jgi:hypothetical protein
MTTATIIHRQAARWFAAKNEPPGREPPGRDRDDGRTGLAT